MTLNCRHALWLGRMTACNQGKHTSSSNAIQVQVRLLVTLVNSELRCYATQSIRQALHLVIKHHLSRSICKLACECKLTSGELSL